ncbi:hypothetical protein FACS1894184_04220 [Clostridia bacterium]|nr:hypothetical protein FACS1894184_04220 [Clostridia bacterium]
MKNRVSRILLITLAAAIILCALSPALAEYTAFVNNWNGGDFLNLRTRPSTSSDSLGGFYTGAKLTVIDDYSYGDWVKVRVGYKGSGTMTGWMSRKYLYFGDYFNNADSIPIYSRSDKRVRLCFTTDKDSVLVTLPTGTDLHVIGFTYDGMRYKNGQYDGIPDGWWFVKATDPRTGDLYSGFVNILIP